MELFEAIRTRQSVRKYADRPVEEEKLNRILEAARLSPSAKNRQARKFIVIRDAERRQKMIEAARGQQFVGSAPVIIACCGLDPDYHMTCGQPADTIDLAIAIDHMTLAATALGLGSCWIGAFYQDQVKQLLGIPEKVQVVELLLLGYASESEFRTSRKGLQEIVAYERWND
ncbi:nitroreductase family protein [bacterium]|nr:nitroreductase family protein [bacterium]